jgi:hypothetical protein
MMVATAATTASFSTTFVTAAEADVATATAILQEVPERLRLKPELEAYPVKDVSLREIDASAGVPVKEANEAVRLEDVARSHSGTVGSLAFVVRRPGCQLCREHGQHVRCATSIIGTSGRASHAGLAGCKSLTLYVLLSALLNLLVLAVGAGSVGIWQQVRDVGRRQGNVG